MSSKGKQDKILSPLALAAHMVTETDSPYYWETKHLLTFRTKIIK